MAGWALFHFLNIGKKTAAEEEREKEDEGELYFSTVFLLYFLNAFLLYFSTFFLLYF